MQVEYAFANTMTTVARCQNQSSAPSRKAWTDSPVPEDVNLGWPGQYLSHGSSFTLQQQPAPELRRAKLYEKNIWQTHYVKLVRLESRTSQQNIYLNLNILTEQS